MAIRYTKAANRKRLADSGMPLIRLEQILFEMSHALRFRASGTTRRKHLMKTMLKLLGWRAPGESNKLTVYCQRAVPWRSASSSAWRGEPNGFTIVTPPHENPSWRSSERSRRQPACEAAERITASQMPSRWSVARSDATSMTAGRLDDGIGIAPAQDGVAGRLPRFSAFSDQHVEEFAQSLHGDEDQFLRKLAKQVESGVAPLCTIGSFGVGKHVGVECELHRSSS